MGGRGPRSAGSRTAPGRTDRRAVRKLPCPTRRSASRAISFIRRFDEQPGALRSRPASRSGGDLDRLAPEKDAAAERQREMEAVPAVAARGGGWWRRRSARSARRPRRATLTMPALAMHRRAARPVRGDADALAGLEPLQHRAQRRRAAAPGRAGDRLHAEIGDRVGDDPAVAMRRDQHVHRRQPLPCHRDHHQAPVPEGEDEAAALARSRRGQSSPPSTVQRLVA